MTNYPAFDLLHTEEDIKEHTIDIVKEHMEDLDEKYDARDIETCRSIILSIESDSYIDSSTAYSLEEILNKAMEQYIIENVGALESGNLPDILIYAEIHKTYIAGK